MDWKTGTIEIHNSNPFNNSPFHTKDDTKRSIFTHSYIIAQTRGIIQQFAESLQKVHNLVEYLSKDMI